MKNSRKSRSWNVQRAMLSREISIGTIAAALIALFSPLTEVEPALAQMQGEQRPNTQNVTIDDIVDNPRTYEGRLVTIRSETDQTDNQYSFLLDDEGVFNLFGLDLDSDELLVLNTTGTGFNLPEGDVEVQVTGIVRPFVRADIERQLGIRLNPNIYAEYENKPALLAQSIAYAPDPSQVSNDPQNFYGRAIVVEGNVNDIYSPYAFSLNDPDLFQGEDVLVISTRPEQFPEDTSVVVVGELRPFTVADVERNYDLGVDLGLPGNLDVEYEQRPILIIREVYPSSIQ